MFLHENDQKMTMFIYFGPRILFVRPERTVGNNGLKSITKFVFSKIWLNQYFRLKMAKVDKMTSFCHQWRHFWVNFKKFWNFKPYFSDSQKHFVQTLFWQYLNKINISLWKLAKYTENDEIHCFSLGKILRKIWSVNYYEKKKSGLWLNYVFLGLDSQMV